MNITFFIGNGFDLNLGLKTGYKSFYKYYTKACPEDMLSKAISADYELWADLELGLGEYLAEIEDSQLDDFLDSKELLEGHLSLYLQNQMNRVQIKNKEEFVNEFIENVGGFYNEFPLSEQRAYKKFLSETGESLVYQFVSFNYTDTLDRLIKSFLSAKKPVASHKCRNTGFGDIVVDPIHIHGDVNSIILGLNDETQIKNESFQSNGDLMNYIIKERVNNALGELRIETVKRTMENSKYICVFGMSIGDTDNMWWVAIIEWLLKDPSRKLVLYVRDGSTIQSVSSQKSIRLMTQKRKHLLNKKQSLDDAQLENIRNRIIIVKNPKIFSFKSVEVKEESNGQAENAQ